MDLLLNPWQRDEGRGWIRSQWIDYILPSPSKHCHEMAKTYYTYMHTYIDNETVYQSSPSQPMAALCNAWIDEITMNRLQPSKLYTKPPCLQCTLHTYMYEITMYEGHRYDHYEGNVSSPCPPLSCHCRTIMVEILSTAYPTKLSTLIVK